MATAAHEHHSAPPSRPPVARRRATAGAFVPRCTGWYKLQYDSRRRLVRVAAAVASFVFLLCSSEAVAASAAASVGRAQHSRFGASSRESGLRPAASTVANSRDRPRARVHLSRPLPTPAHRQSSSWWVRACSSANCLRHWCAMDYQCIVVYTIITILPPDEQRRYDESRWSAALRDGPADGCLGVVRRWMKRYTVTIILSY